MHCVKKITDDLIWVGANDRRLAMFEGVYSVPNGVSYNSYLLMDEKIVLFDTVDKAVRERFLENLTYALGGKAPDYLIVQHMEPDHSTAIMELSEKYPQMQFVCNAKTLNFIHQFFDIDITDRTMVVKEGDTLNTGRHNLTFVMAPMVHWPEVMVTYDSTDKILFSADGFGCFGALNGALFADEVDFSRDYMDEARRYYTNIVGKYGPQVSALLTKTSTLDIQMICPLHGFVWRRDLSKIVSKYALWANYQPEEYGVMIAYASVYGNTENAAEILSSELRSKGVKTVMFDVSVTPTSEILSSAFKWSHLVLAATTYNAGIFISMEEFINDLVAHNIQNRTVAIIENGSWAATSGTLMREKFAKCKNITFIEEQVSLKSSLKASELSDIDKMVDALVATLPNAAALDLAQVAKDSSSSNATGSAAMMSIDTSAMFKLSYGLFVLTAKDGDKDNGCIINTAMQLTSDPLQISITVNKANMTHDMILKTGLFNLSVLSTSTPFSIFQQFGFQSGKTSDKFKDSDYDTRTADGVRYLPSFANSVISARVSDTYDCGTHTLFIASVTEAFILSQEPSVTYQYYFDNIKPKLEASSSKKSGYVCKICGYIYEGEPLPPDFICPLCKHGAADFEKL